MFSNIVPTCVLSMIFVLETGILQKTVTSSLKCLLWHTMCYDVYSHGLEISLMSKKLCCQSTRDIEGGCSPSHDTDVIDARVTADSGV